MQTIRKQSFVMTKKNRHYAFTQETVSAVYIAAAALLNECMRLFSKMT